MDEVIRRVIKKLLERNYSEQKIFEMFQNSSKISQESKPSLEEILEIALGFDTLEIQKDQESETSPPTDQTLSQPLKEKPTHLQCPNCQTITPYRLSKAKRPRKQCPHCKTKREVKYWIPLVQPQKDQEKTKSEISLPKDQPLPIREKSEMEARTQKDQKDHLQLARETFSQNREKLLSHPEVQTVLKFVGKHLYPSNIAKQSGYSKSKVSRILQKLQKAHVIKETNKYPKFYDIIYGSKVQAPMWIQKIEDIHRVEYLLYIKNPRSPGPTETYHDLYDKEFPHAKKTKLGGWSRYEINWSEDPSHPYGWNIQFNRNCIVCKYALPLTDITDPIETKRYLEKQLPYDFFKSKGIEIDPTITSLRAGGGHARIKTNIPHLDSLGARQAVSVINDSTGDEIFHADNSENSDDPGIETSIKQATRLLSVPQQIEGLQRQMTELLQSIQSMQQERSQVQDLINTLQQFTTTLQGNTKAPVEITNPSPNMFT